MTPVAAPCGDGCLLDAWRREGFAGAVHSVFDRVVNLADARDGRLVTLAARSLDNAPNTLLVDVARFAAYPLRTGMSAATRSATLHIGSDDFVLRFDRAAPWHAQLPSYPRDAARLRDNLAAMQAHLAGYVAREDAVNGLGAAMPCTALLETRFEALAQGVHRGDIDGVCTHGRALLGLGPGLTPSGDDFLVGLFAVLHLAHSPCHGLRHACDAIAADAPARTHPISVAALREAARGRVRDSVRTLLCELVEGHPAGVRRALARVLAIGATSGRYIVTGIACGLEANVQACDA